MQSRRSTAERGHFSDAPILEALAQYAASNHTGGTGHYYADPVRLHLTDKTAFNFGAVVDDITRRGV
jgi:hypothetical protein